MAAITIVGVGLDGCAGLTSFAVNAASRAQVLYGTKRLLGAFPQFEGQRIALEGSLLKALEEIRELSFENDVCLLASGDPLFFGIAGLVAKRLGRKDLVVVPGVSSMQQAFAAALVPWSRAGLFSVHGRALDGLVARLGNVPAAGVFTDGINHPGLIAAHLIEFLPGSHSDWCAHVCENLGDIDQRVRSFDDLGVLAILGADDFAALNVLVLVRKDPSWRAPAALSYLDEDLFAKRMPKKGLITKREVRALTLANLRINRDAIVWDIGTASGSVAIEAARLASDGYVYAMEVDAESVAFASENIRTHGADNVTVLHGRAPEILAEIPSKSGPDAVFIGGSKGSLDAIVSAATEAMNPGGRIVANAITMESVAAALAAFRAADLDPEVTLLQISRGKKLAHYLRYEALNPIHIIAATKPFSK